MLQKIYDQDGASIIFTGVTKRPKEAFKESLRAISPPSVCLGYFIDPESGIKLYGFINPFHAILGPAPVYGSQKLSKNPQDFYCENGNVYRIDADRFKKDDRKFWDRALMKKLLSASSSRFKKYSLKPLMS